MPKRSKRSKRSRLVEADVQTHSGAQDKPYVHDLSYCARCNELISAISSLLAISLEKQKAASEPDDLAGHGASQQTQFVLQMSPGCSLCALIFDWIPAEAVGNILQLEDPNLTITVSAEYDWIGGEYSHKLEWSHPALQSEAGQAFKSDHLFIVETELQKPSVDCLISPQMDSTTSWELASSWLQSCKKSHECMPSLSSDPELPTRLIRIVGSTSSSIDESDLHARLIICAEEIAERRSINKYCTLSHCWGMIEMVKLDRHTLIPFQKDIPLGILSKTFRHAIYAAKKLGFDFIWIDSLCIIQGDKDDWAREAGRMSSVYRYSSLNLAATAAPDGNTGMLCKRDPTVVKACHIKVPSRHKHRLTIASTSLWIGYIETAPLATRGWVFQERYLASCTLHFAATQMFWECKTLSACETFPTQEPPIPCLGLTTNRHSRLRRGDLDLFEWLYCVDRFCSGKLTMESDKLVAMSGIASYFHSVTGDEYLAGLWKTRIEEQLLWRTPDQDSERRLTYNTRPSKYRAPSWSWAAVDGPLLFSRFQDRNAYNEYPEEFHFCRIVSSNIELCSDLDRFGGVKSASVEIECGALKQITIDNDTRYFLQTSRGSITISLSFDTKSDFNLAPASGHDSSNHDIFHPPPRTVFLLLVDIKSSSGLMLQQTEQQGHYRRCGHFEMKTPNAIWGRGIAEEEFRQKTEVSEKSAYTRINQRVNNSPHHGEYKYTIVLV